MRSRRRSLGRRRNHSFPARNSTPGGKHYLLIHNRNLKSVVMAEEGTIGQA